MKLRLSVLCLFLAATSLLGQTSASSSGVSGGPANASGGVAPSVIPELDRLQSAASQANLDLGHMRMEKWKADADSKRQAQANADSVQRNLTSALPELIQAVRSAPQDLSAQFKLYRNLNVLYDVMANLTESAGAFGSKSDYQTLSQSLETIDSVRRSLADSLERLTSSTQSQLDQLRTQLRAEQQRAAAAAVPPKKVVVDDTAPKKTTHKKKPAKPATESTSSTPASQAGSNGSTGTASTPTKSQSSPQ